MSAEKYQVPAPTGQQQPVLATAPPAQQMVMQPGVPVGQQVMVMENNEAYCGPISTCIGVLLCFVSGPLGKGCACLCFHACVAACGTRWIGKKIKLRAITVAICKFC